jgi:hypothetical protein
MLSRIICLFALNLCLSGLAVTAVCQTKQASEAEKWREDLAVMAARMEATHKNLYHSVTREDFAAAVKKLDARIPSLPRHRIIVEMMRIVAMVGDGHTNIYPTRDQKIGFHSLPVKLYLFSDGMFIRAAERKYADIVGARVVKIGSVGVDEAVARAGEIVGHDNEMGVRFFAPVLLAMPEVLEALGLSYSVERASLTVEKDGKQRVVELPAAGPVEMTAADTDLSWVLKEGWVDMRENAPETLWLRDPKNMFWFEYLRESKVVYAQINQIGNKGDESLASFSKRLFDFVDANPVDKLVVDLRLDRGGNGSLLTPLEIAMVKSKIDQRGKLFILTGRSTWSAAQFLLDWAERYTNAIFVGEPSASRGNAYGDSRRITLPNSGVTARASVYYWQDWHPTDARPWSAPEITAELSSAEYASGRDPALRAALEFRARPTLAEVLGNAVTAGGGEMAAKRFREFRSDRVNKYADAEQPLLEAGQRLLNEKKPDQALLLFRLVQELNPRSYSGHYAAGVANAELGKKEEAAKDLKRALELYPRNFDVTSLIEKLNR